jgi:hypothetical protein
MLREQIAEQPAQTRLSVAILFQAASLPRFRNSGNVEMSGDYRRPKHQIIPITLAIRDAII